MMSDPFKEEVFKCKTVITLLGTDHQQRDCLEGSSSLFLNDLS